MKTFGRVTYRKGRLYFNANQWALIKTVARRQHKSPTKVVRTALRRGCGLAKKG